MKEQQHDLELLILYPNNSPNISIKFRQGKAEEENIIISSVYNEIRCSKEPIVIPEMCMITNFHSQCLSHKGEKQGREQAALTSSPVESESGRCYSIC